MIAFKESYIYHIHKKRQILWPPPVIRMNHRSLVLKEYNPQTRGKFQDPAPPLFNVDVINVSNLMKIIIEKIKLYNYFKSKCYFHQISKSRNEVSFLSHVYLEHSMEFSLYLILALLYVL